MLSLMCIDVDGTLVGTQNVVRDDVWAALSRARTAGLQLALCSGRAAVGNALAYAQRLEPQGWHIFQNGASVIHIGTRHTGTGESRSAELPESSIAELLDRAPRDQRLLELYTDRDWAIYAPNQRAQEYARRHAELLGLPLTALTPPDLTGPVVRAQWLLPWAEGERLLRTAPPPQLEWHPAGSPAMPDVMFISLTRTGIDKGWAVARLAEQYGCPLDRVMMVGDGHNDVSAMQKVGHSVAMGNAEPEVLSIARHRVGHVDEGGLIEALELALNL